jgi:rhamnogalacturonan endolyase
VPEPNVNLTVPMHNPDADDRFNYLGHGDAVHVGDFNPGIPGPEVFLTAEQPADFHSLGPAGDKGLGYRPSAAVYDPRTGEVLVGMYSLAGDLERGVAANIDPNQPGAEFWTNGFVWSAITGERLYANASGAAGLPYNFLLYWDGDLQREIRTLMHDPQYCLSVASEGSVYNQPPHPGFFLDDDTETYPLPARRTDIDVSRVEPLD